jgi:SOS-response transcriptional repressor LexA
MSPDPHEVLNFITTHRRNEGYPPALSQIAQHFGISKDAARQCVDVLIDEGHLQRFPASPAPLRKVLAQPTVTTSPHLRRVRTERKTA